MTMIDIIMFPALITSVILTIIYMKSHILIHTGPTSQFNAVLQVWIVMLVISGAIWYLIGWIFGGIFSFIKDNIEPILFFGAIAAGMYWVDQKKKEIEKEDEENHPQ